MFTSLRMFAGLFGIIFIALGAMGFMPSFLTNGKLFDLLPVDTMHNSLHLIVGVFGIIAAMKIRFTKLYFILVGILFAALAGVGFMHEGDIYGMQVGSTGNVFHVIVAILAFYLGLMRKPKRV